MTARGGHALAFLLLASLLGASAAASNGTVEPFIGDTPTVDKQLILDQGEFPAARPPLWRFRTLDTATEATCQKKGNGWKLTVKHKDLKGITPPMMVWLYKNLASGVSTHPVDKQKYPNFLLFHPRDHIKHIVVSPAGPLARKSWTRWIEFPLTGCRRKAPDAFDFDCPTDPAPNPGWLLNSSNAWIKLEQTNASSNVRKQANSNVRFASRGCSNPPDGGPCAWVTKTTQEWKTNKQTNELSITTTLRIGIGMGGPDKKITEGWRNGVDPELKCNRARLHLIEEIGGLENWLPQAYAEAGSPV